jgi:hypothetical protein
METTLKGSCLCGSVRYSVSTNLDSFYFCHCAQCRKVTGSAFAANILAQPADVEWLCEPTLVRRFDHPSRAFTKVFCTICGSGLPFLNKDKTALYIPAGSLDETPPIKPAENIFWADRADWYEAGVSSPCCDAFPDES